MCMWLNVEKPDVGTDSHSPRRRTAGLCMGRTCVWPAHFAFLDVYETMVVRLKCGRRTSCVHMVFGQHLCVTDPKQALEASGPSSLVWQVTITTVRPRMVSVSTWMLDVKGSVRMSLVFARNGSQKFCRPVFLACRVSVILPSVRAGLCP